MQGHIVTTRDTLHHKGNGSFPLPAREEMLTEFTAHTNTADRDLTTNQTPMLNASFQSAFWESK